MLMSLAPTLAATGSAPPLVVDLLVVLAVASVVALALRRLRLEPIPAYLVAGVFIGPSALGWISSADSLDAISRLAIVLLMFGIGLHLDLRSIGRGAGWLLAAGTTTTLVSVAGGFPVALAFGLDMKAALAVAMAMSLSSTAVVLRILAARRELHTVSGRLTMTTLIVQDLLVIPMLALVGILAPMEEGEAGGWLDGLHPATGLLVRVLGVALVVIVGKWVLPRLLEEAARSRSDEVMTGLSVAAALGAAAVTQALGFSPELGAFLAGFVLAGTTFKHQLSGQIGPARDLFIAVFFTSVGMAVPPGALAEWWWVILLGAGATLALKALFIGAGAWAIGAPASVAVVAALSLCQAGEFSLILLSISETRGLIGETTGDVASAIIVLTLIATPGLMGLGRRISARAIDWPHAPWLMNCPMNEREQDAPAADAAFKPAIVCGFGVVGRAVCDELDQAGVRVTLIEMNPQTVRTQQRLGRRAIYGDASNPEILDAAGVREAGALIVTIPDEEAAVRACATARRINPDLFIALRTNFAGRGLIARAAGADFVVVEEIAVAEAMQRQIMERLRSRQAGPARKQD
jgi:CPA2 family monovalent cation:H+ antiporter-2